jgi:GPI mannosyltransferase 1 subunit M
MNKSSIHSSPYTRETYRYTPLLALLMTPNIFLHPSFGKYLFALCDLVNGVLIYSLLCSPILRLVPPLQADSPTSKPKENEAGNKLSTPADRNQRLALVCSAIHLLNPMVFSISTRGSSESILCTLVLLTLFAALNDCWNTSAVLLGLSTHWKIYPAIYGVSCVTVLGAAAEGAIFPSLRSLASWRTMRFAAISAGTFLALGAGCYAM